MAQEIRMGTAKDALALAQSRASDDESADGYLGAGQDDYTRFRGKCKEMSEAIVAADPSSRLVRGHYHCPVWGEQAHWWTVDRHGLIVDPTARQFPSKGAGAYVEFDGRIECSDCGKEGKEEDGTFHFESNYCFCSTACHMRFVGL